MNKNTKEAIENLKSVSSEMRDRVDKLDEWIQSIEKSAKVKDYDLRALVRFYFGSRGLTRAVDIGVLDRKEYNAWTELLQALEETP